MIKLTLSLWMGVLCLTLLPACQKKPVVTTTAESGTIPATDAPAAPTAEVAATPSQLVPAESKPPAAPANSSAPAAPTGPTAAEIELQKRRQTLSELTMALHRWLQDKPDIPQNIDVYTLVRDGYLKAIPVPPAGLRYAVNPTNLQVEFAR